MIIENGFSVWHFGVDGAKRAARKCVNWICRQARGAAEWDYRRHRRGVRLLRNIRGASIPLLEPQMLIELKWKPREIYFSLSAVHSAKDVLFAAAKCCSGISHSKSAHRLSTFSAHLTIERKLLFESRLTKSAVRDYFVSSLDDQLLKQTSFPSFLVPDIRRFISIR